MGIRYHSIKDKQYTHQSTCPNQSRQRNQSEWAQTNWNLWLINATELIYNLSLIFPTYVGEMPEVLCGLRARILQISFLCLVTLNGPHQWRHGWIHLISFMHAFDDHEWVIHELVCLPDDLPASLPGCLPKWLTSLPACLHRLTNWLTDWLTDWPALRAWRHCTAPNHPNTLAPPR